MPGKVNLKVVEGPMVGQSFAFDQHDAFLFGRMTDCHACLLSDPGISRHHFIIEANPPEACIRDLGSLNGTYVNGMKYGGRAKTETPEEGARKMHPVVDLKSGDRVKAGLTTLEVSMESAAICGRCGAGIDDAQREQCVDESGNILCQECREKLESTRVMPPPPPQPMRCQKCGKDVTVEIGEGRKGDYICEKCRQKTDADPMDILLDIICKTKGLSEAPDLEGHKILRKLGEGGFGAVYLARRKKDDKYFAVKVMLSKVAVDEQARNAFMREIEVTKGLRHRNIVSLIDHGSAGGAFYFIMDYCDGGGVDHLMEQRGGKLSVEEAAPIMTHSLDGLSYAHNAKFIHRDLKPANILIAGSGDDMTVKISDFGLAKDFERAGFSGMTMTGMFAGTPPFMPREQLTNFRFVRPASDIWSLGATFYNMLTGAFVRNFPARKNPMEVILKGGIVPIRRRDSSIPKKLAQVIDRSIEDKPEKRFQSADEFRDALRSAL